MFFCFVFVITHKLKSLIVEYNLTVYFWKRLTISLILTCHSMAKVHFSYLQLAKPFTCTCVDDVVQNLLNCGVRKTLESVPNLVIQPWYIWLHVTSTVLASLCWCPHHAHDVLFSARISIIIISFVCLVFFYPELPLCWLEHRTLYLLLPQRSSLNVVLKEWGPCKLWLTWKNM